MTTSYSRLNSTVLMASGGATTAAFDVTGASQGAWETPATFEPTTVKFQGGDGLGDTFIDVYDKAGAIITMATAAASRAYAFPAECFAFRFLKIVGTVGGNVAADRTITLHFGSN